MTISTKFDTGQEVWINNFNTLGSPFTEKGKITTIMIFERGCPLYEIQTKHVWTSRPEEHIYETEQAALENREKEYYAINYDYNKAKRK